MQAQSILPTPVVNEVEGAGSFFGSCQVAANEFSAMLADAVEQFHATGSAPKSQVQQMLEALLGEEGAQAYQDFVKMLGKDSSEKDTLADIAKSADDSEGDETIDAQALMLAIQQLLVQLEQKWNVTGNSDETDDDADDLPTNPATAFFATGDQLKLLENLRSLLAGLQSLANVDGSQVTPADGSQATPADAVLSTVGVQANSANLVTLPAGVEVKGELSPDDVTEAQESVNALIEKMNAAKSAVSLPEKAVSASEETSDSDTDSSADDGAKNAHSAASPVHELETETRVHWDGSKLQIDVVDSRTGTKLHSSATTPYADMASRIQEFDVVRQVAEKVRFLAHDGTQSMSMRLNPEELGSVDLRIVMKQGEMQIHARVESEVAQRALESNAGLLREGLEKQNIVLDRLEVSVERKSDGQSTGWAQEGSGKSSDEERRKSRRAGSSSRDQVLAVSVQRGAADTGRRLGYNTMEYLA